jgi:hypothetical protein
VNRARVVTLLVATVLFAGPGGLAACGDDASGPDAADSCEELVEEAALVARDLGEQFAGASGDDIDPGTPDDPYPELTEPFEPYRVRAAELGCDAGELRRLACDAYQGLEPTGPAMEEFLAELDDVCS